MARAGGEQLSRVGVRSTGAEGCGWWLRRPGGPWGRAGRARIRVGVCIGGFGWVFVVPLADGRENKKIAGDELGGICPLLS